MKIAYQTERVTLWEGDSATVLPTLPDASIDAVVTDPPAGIGFMGKTWDKFETPGGGHISERLPTVTVGGTPNRNPICQTCGKRQRGEPKRGPCECETPLFDSQQWRMKGRAAFIDFLTSVMVECFRIAKPGAYALVWAIPKTSHWTATAIEDAGWVIQDRISHLFGQGFPKHKSKLKPACEDWWLAWKPDRRATPLNIDACRVPADEFASPPSMDSRRNGSSRENYRMPNGGSGSGATSPLGRWPANVVLTCCGNDPHDDDCPVAMLDRQSGVSASTGGSQRHHVDSLVYGEYGQCGGGNIGGLGDIGGASRFFYCPKASRSDRGKQNTHPTVKNTELMGWLCRLITPENGRILDPFAGSGSTLVAAMENGFGATGIEQQSEYVAIAARRLEAAERDLANQLFP